MPRCEARWPQSGSWSGPGTGGAAAAPTLHLRQHQPGHGRPTHTHHHCESWWKPRGLRLAGHTADRNLGDGEDCAEERPGWLGLGGTGSYSQAPNHSSNATQSIASPQQHGSGRVVVITQPLSIMMSLVNSPVELSFLLCHIIMRVHITAQW